VAGLCWVGMRAWRLGAQGMCVCEVGAVELMFSSVATATALLLLLLSLAVTPVLHAHGRKEEHVKFAWREIFCRLSATHTRR